VTSETKERLEDAVELILDRDGTVLPSLVEDAIQWIRQNGLVEEARAEIARRQK
jgi:hypothetical protein